MAKKVPIIEFQNITKEFPGIIANNNISFQVNQGTIHGLIGENGAGKSTLMSILFGLYEQTSGVIKIKGKNSFVKNPNEANMMGIGMVHQHFKLVDVYSNLENIIMGDEFVNQINLLDKKAATSKILALQETYNLDFDLKQKTANATLATQQKVEVMKMLYRDTEILIFDEPTAVLTDEEIQSLLKTILRFKQMKKTVILITHKLNEIKAVCDAATVLRLGKVVKNYDNLEKVNVAEIAKMMVGTTVNLPKNTQQCERKKVVLEFQNVSYHKQLQNVSFKIHQGEILAIAGVEGNGQEEIEFLATGLLKPKKGKIIKYNYNNQANNSKDSKPTFIDLTHASVRKKAANKINYIPSDRHKYGLVLDFNVIDNVILRTLYAKKTSFYGWLDRVYKKQFALEIIKKFDVRGAREGGALTRSMSGGNQQKVILGRELLIDHDLLIVAQPARGLDVGAINLIHQQILAERAQNKAILLISYELDEVLSLADTILVVNKKQVVALCDKFKTNRTEIGLMMSGSHQSSHETTNQEKPHA